MSARKRKKCYRGHSFSKTNTYHYRGRQFCRMCAAIRAKEFNERKKLADGKKKRSNGQSRKGVKMAKKATKKSSKKTTKTSKASKKTK